MRSCELTPGRIVDPVVGPSLVHGVVVRSMAWIARVSFRAVATRATGQQPRFLCEVVVREPTVRGVLYMRDDRVHERAAEPAIGPPRNRPMVHRAQPGL